MAHTVFFDLDGTLYDNGIVKLLLPFRAFHGNPIRNLRLMAGERRCRRKLSRSRKGTEGYDALFRMMSARTGLSTDAISDWYWYWYMPSMVSVIRRHCKAREGVVARIMNLKENGDRIAILSDYGCCREKLEALGIDCSLFEALLDAPSLGGFKPCPDVFRAACQYMGCNPSDTLMVGDRTDTDGGCTAIGIAFTDIKTFLIK